MADENDKALMADQVKAVSEPAKRALAEADARRAMKILAPSAREIAGRDGPEPTRYGDWEIKGLASDF